MAKKKKAEKPRREFTKRQLSQWERQKKRQRIIFGIGMTIAGGCTVGATWRAGEGHVKLWLALVGIVLSMPLTAEYIMPGFIDMLPGSMNQQVFLPDTYGYVGAICIMLMVLLLWYVFAKWNDRTGKFAALG